MVKHAVFFVCLVVAFGAGAQAGKLVSTYDPGVTTWLRGNIHTHTTESDGKKPPQEVVDIFAGLGYDFLMISDHDKVTAVDMLDAKGMTLISGNEISAKGPHLLHVGAQRVVAPDVNRQAVLDEVGKAGGFAVMNHPNWRKNYDHCPLEVLEKLQGYVGIEIFNGVVIELEGCELATDKWDRLLAQGRRIYGFATDDSHDYPRHAGVGWLMVQSAARDGGSIVAALQAGRFYASTGVTVDEIAVNGLTAKVRAGNAEKIRVVADYGQVLLNVPGPSAEFTVKPGEKSTYIRFEFYGPGDAMAWLQPMFID